MPSISVIIPALDEAGRLGPVLDGVRAGGPGEIVVVDGGSTDATAEVARNAGAVVLESPPGRGVQLNAGARAATGDLLLFLHADTRLPEGWPGHVARIAGTPGVSAGAFRLRIDDPHRALRVVERAVNWRSRVLGRPYGDQAIFVTAREFRAVGGFPDAPAMEDFELVRRLRRRGRIVIADAAVTTSARRWLSCGVVRTTLLNQACVAAYLLGVPARRIAAWRSAFLQAGRRRAAGARHSPDAARLAEARR